MPPGWRLQVIRILVGADLEARDRVQLALDGIELRRLGFLPDLSGGARTRLQNVSKTEG
jgi:hypothetical protein